MPEIVAIYGKIVSICVDYISLLYSVLVNMKVVKGFDNLQNYGSTVAILRVGQYYDCITAKLGQY